MNDRRPWFGPKRVGWGLRPQAWQAWALLVLLVIVVLALARLVPHF
jgi:hypothetical protein